MPQRAMNNKEKVAASILKENGFYVFWFDSGYYSSGYYATHPKLIMQYHVESCFNQALEDLKNKLNKT